MEDKVWCSVLREYGVRSRKKTRIPASSKEDRKIVTDPGGNDPNIVTVAAGTGDPSLFSDPLNRRLSGM